MFAMDKQFSLLQKLETYRQKKFYNPRPLSPISLFKQLISQPLLFMKS